jgi:hypothetical protein
MRKIVLLAVAVAALAIVGFASGVAGADNGAVTTHFTASYTDSIGVDTCSGENIYKTGPKAFNKDSETCLVNPLFIPVGTYTGVFWCSDSAPPAHSAGLCTTDDTLTITANGDGTYTDSVVAYYH